MKKKRETLMALVAALALAFLAAGCSVRCPTCGGSGKVVSIGALSIDCITCNGTGKVKRSSLEE